jgi:ATP-dependent phosphofructokinase / diphosphate-dependent phosphofructokinase
MAKRIGILTAGSDCPGLNAAIRAVGKTARNSYGMQILGFQDGFQGLVQDRTLSLEGEALSGILSSGGTILGTSREQPNRIMEKGQPKDMLDMAVANIKKHDLDALVCIGGRETQLSALHLMQRGVNVVTLPKAIDNIIPGTDVSIGFNTALDIATEAIDRLHSTAYSNHRVILVEILGREAGWLTLGAGIAGGADVISIPEIPYDAQKIAEAVLERNHEGKKYSIIAVAEGAVAKETVTFFEHSRKVNETLRIGDEREKVDETLDQIEDRLTGNAIQLAYRIEHLTGLETRVTILGHLLRGGGPSSTDRILATQLGTASVQMVNEGHFGVMVAQLEGVIQPVPLEKVAGLRKLVPAEHTWIDCARRVGTSLGD